jgi:antitoxin (DNA-binding transcriptional repressor) of toxin-antitoxin stability system
MTTVNIHEAKTQLSKLVNLALEGEDVVISRRKKPLVRLSVIEQETAKRKVGSCKGLIVKMADGVLDPLDEYEDSLVPSDAPAR